MPEILWQNVKLRINVMNSLWIGKHHTSHTIGVLRWLKISMECLSWCAFVVSEWFAFVVSEWFAFQCREWVICFVVTQNTKERHRRVNSFIVKNVNYDHGDFVPKKKKLERARGRGGEWGEGEGDSNFPSPPLPQRASYAGYITILRTFIAWVG